MRNAYGPRLSSSATGKHKCGILMDINVGGGRPHRCATSLQGVIKDDRKFCRKSRRKSALNAFLRQHHLAIHKGLHGADRLSGQGRRKRRRHRAEFQRCQISRDPKQRVVAHNADAITRAYSVGKHFCNHLGARLMQVSIRVVKPVGDDGDVVIASVFQKIVSGIHAPPHSIS